MEQSKWSTYRLLFYLKKNETKKNGAVAKITSQKNQQGYGFGFSKICNNGKCISSHGNNLFLTGLDHPNHIVVYLFAFLIGVVKVQEWDFL